MGESLSIHLSLGHQIGRNCFDLSSRIDVRGQIAFMANLVFPQCYKVAIDEVSSSRFTRELSERTEDGKHGCGVELLGLLPC